MEAFFKILLFFLVFIMSISSATRTLNKSYQKYIRTCCNSTTYPNVCYKTLSAYASTIKTDPYKLCDTSLTATLKAAKNASASISDIAKQKRLNETEEEIVKDCIENIRDSVDELKQSLKSMKNIGNYSDSGNSTTAVAFQIANIQTWVSAAMSDEDTCIDGYDGTKTNEEVKEKIRKIVLNLAKLTSNSLALINSLKY